MYSPFSSRLVVASDRTDGRPLLCFDISRSLCCIAAESGGDSVLPRDTSHVRCTKVPSLTHSRHTALCYCHCRWCICGRSVFWTRDPLRLLKLEQEENYAHSRASPRINVYCRPHLCDDHDRTFLRCPYLSRSCLADFTFGSTQSGWTPPTAHDEEDDKRRHGSAAV